MGYGYKGQKEYEQFKKGKRLSYKGSVLAKCYECMGFYDGGREDCMGKNSCPLYQFYPYAPKKRTLLDEI